MQWKQVLPVTLGLLLVAAGIALPFAGIADEGPAPTALVSAGIAMLIVTMITTFRYRDEVQADERTKKIGAYGITYSWLFTLVLVFLLFWVDYLDLAALSLQGVLALLGFGMILSARAFQWYLFRKGDVA
ncbi:hypothetical protein ABH15_00385 [Methanoculleus taiwanensis]|uniref:DUF2178 domain-containing protein n=1 Tax=Methanoculleus taiwanensis TaxID=1550565 RepID=A0A498H3P4_9EURY|nr:hypothetical protein [Methanoculleus taiwanensis]RXE56680.1 hypothetical protein ABH15_00385 [Methanoculleus taiwanensis]